MRRNMLIGNWKMHKTIEQARAFAEELGRHSQSLQVDVDFAVCPPFTAMHALRVILPADVAMGAQNVHYEPKGAFTGEISADMLSELGVAYVIVGHSERRHVFGEPDDWVRDKTSVVAKAGMTPILCVGEDMGEREHGQTLQVVERQTKAGLSGLSPEETAKAVIAYEPVWAIGSGQTPSVEQAQEVIAQIRTVVAQEKGEAAAQAVRILYGGSVKPENIAAFINQPDIDGALVGGASLEAQSFIKMATAIAGGE